MFRVLAIIALVGFPLSAMSQPDPLSFRWKCTISEQGRFDIHTGRFAMISPGADKQSLDAYEPFDVYAIFDEDKQSLDFFDAKGTKAGQKYRFVARSKSEMEWLFVQDDVPAEMPVQNALLDLKWFIHVITNGNHTAWHGWDGRQVFNGPCQPLQGN